MRWLVLGIAVCFALSGASATPVSASFGLQSNSFESLLVGEGGGSAHGGAFQAGSHAFDVTTQFKFNTTEGLTGEQIPEGSVKDVEVELPPGLIGNPTATPKCSIAQFNTSDTGEAFGLSGASCPNDSQIGVAQVEITPNGEGEPVPLTLGIYNLVAPPGVPAEFGFNPIGVAVVLTPTVRTGSDYGVTISSKNTNQTLRVFGVKTTFWGAPSSPVHNGERGECLGGLGETYALGVEHPCPVETGGRPFLRLPTSCGTASLNTTIHLDSWEAPVPSAELEGVTEVALLRDGEGHTAGVVGCERLDFSPMVSVRPETAMAGFPTGASVEVSLPQNESSTGLAESDLKGAEASLPAGMSVSPAAANQLQACSEEQIALDSAAMSTCPEASKVGTVEIETPLLESPLQGSVYVAQPEQNKFHSLLALYVVAEGSGVVIKLAGEARANPATGQLTTTFVNNPQQPFSHLRLHLFGGPRAALATPRNCGTYRASGALTPWSSDLPVVFSEPIEIAGNCGGGFAPSFVAGTLSNHAAGFSPLTITLNRADQEQAFKQLTIRTPPGLLAMISKVQVCHEPLITQQACPSASQIGHVTVGAGVGSEPVYLPQAGRPEDPVYLTDGYGGAPFGLLTIVHAEAGPFNLGVVPVRAALNVDRRTSQAVATTEQLPTILKGIPVDVKTINILLDREGFVFNPTDCEPLKFEGNVLGDEGTTAPVTSRFQAANCATLGFAPKFTASTSARPSHTKGASLIVKVGYPASGAQANIAAVKVSLPRQLPARLTTLQHACTEAAFAANPATCPPESVVGTATGVTPVLNMPVSGPAYLVSHGGAAFPDLVLLLQGQGVTVELIGNTDISKGVTTSTFDSVPDVPISSFEVNLPQGPHSALTENLTKKNKGTFCHSSLVMPTTIIAQNGARIAQTTKIAVTGCRVVIGRPKARSRRKG